MCGYATHKAIHDNLRENVLPALEEDLEKQDISKDAVTYFLSVFTGWLYSHILIEDRAIVGTALSRYNKPANMENAKLLDKNSLGAYFQLAYNCVLSSDS